MALLLLIAAAFAAGAINSVAGGGTFLTFPSLVFAGVPAVAANASSTVALVPGSLASAISYRGDIQRAEEKRLKLWFLVSVLGGALGAGLLLCTSDRTFRQVAPWLLLFATVLFAFGPQVSLALRGRLHSNQALLLALLIPISIYGGYFGGGIGIMILAAFRLYGLDDIHAMNGMKTILSGSLNAIAALIFITAHQVAWVPTLVMMVSAIAGGYLGPVLARRAPPAAVRATVSVVGAVLPAWFFHISHQSAKSAARRRPPTALQHRPDPPRLKSAMPQFLGPRQLARGYLQKPLKDLSPYLFDRRLPIRNPARIDIHVVAHAPVGLRIARDLQHRNARKTNGAAPARGKGNQVDPARSQSSKRNRIIAWRVHKDKARLHNPLCIINRVF